MFVEGIMRRPRLWSNKELKKFAPIFSGNVINVSGANDLDKEVKNYFEYLFSNNYNSGNFYRKYFTNSSEYTISNYVDDNVNGHGKKYQDVNYLDLDLNQKIPESLIGKYDVVYNHTVLEHVFDVFTAFQNLCLLTSDIVILVVPSVQVVHDYVGAYKDYWRFTPFAIDRLFKENNMTVIYRNSNKAFSSSIYYFYIATKNPDKWENEKSFKSSKEILKMNMGAKVFLFSFFHIRIEAIIRKIATSIFSVFKK